MVRPPYWLWLRIAGAASSQEVRETFDGECALAGVDPWKLPPDRFVNAFLVWLRNQYAEREHGAAEWNALRTQLFAPPERERERPGAPLIEAEGAAFMAFMAAARR